MKRNPGWRHTWEGKCLHFFSPHPIYAKYEHSSCGSVSDIYVQKNFKNLICAVARIASEHSDVKLKIAGQPIDTEYFAELKKMVSEQKLDGKVEFLGQVHPQELVALYQRCGVFVFPSTVETFGNPLVEAMACGAPIACSNTAAMPEVVGDAAVFFDPLNIESITSAISSFLNDADDTSIGERIQYIAAILSSFISDCHNGDTC